MAEINYYSPPVYPGMSSWELIENQSRLDGNSSFDFDIDQKKLPTTKIAVRNNSESDSINIAAFSPIIGSPALWLSQAGYTGIGTFQSSYRQWLQSDEKYSSTFDFSSNFGTSGFNPIFDYSILDLFKESVHFGTYAIFEMYIQTAGYVLFTGIDSSYGYPEFIVRSKMRGFRQKNGEILGINVISTGDSTWTYDLITTLRNERTDKISFQTSSSNELTLKITIKKGSSFVYETLIVSSITGGVIRCHGAKQDLKNGVPIGWIGSYFDLSKTVITNDPSLIYFDMKHSSASGSPIPNNPYLVKIEDSFETRENTYKADFSVKGIYFSSSIILNNLSFVTNGAEIEEYIRNTPSSLFINSDLCPIGVSNALAPSIVIILKAVKASSLVVYTTTIGGTTTKHNMHASCLTNEFCFSGNSDTFLIKNQIRGDILEISVDSYTSAGVFWDYLDSSKKCSVIASRMWFFNDVFFQLGSSTNCNRGLFCGKQTEDPILNNDKNTVVNIKVEDGFVNYANIKDLRKFIDDVPFATTNTTTIKRWSKFLGWRLVDSDETGFDIISLVGDDQTNICKIVLSGDVVNSLKSNISNFYRISFGSRLETLGYSPIYTSSFQASASLIGSSGSAASFTYSGLYLGTPHKINIPTGSSFTLVQNSWGFSENIPPQIYLSLGSSKSLINFCKNQNIDTGDLLYGKTEDSSVALYIRRANLSYIYDVKENIIFYGTPITKAISSVSGSSGANISLVIGSDLRDKSVVGLNLKGDFDHVTSKSSIWQAFYGDEALGFKTVGGVTSTLLSREGGYATKNENFRNIYIGANSSSSGCYFPLLINTGNLNSPYSEKIILKPVGSNASSSPSVSGGDVLLVYNENVVKDFSDPYMFVGLSGYENIFYVKDQNWLQKGVSSIGYCKKISDFGSSFSISKILPKNSSDTDLQYFNKKIDLSQTGVFFMTTNSHLKTFSSGIFHQSQDDGSKISELTSVDSKDLSRIPFLLIPNIRGCAYTNHKDEILVAGFSDVPESDGGAFSVLSLVFYRINILSTINYPVYCFSDGFSSNSFSKLLFSYSILPPALERRIMNKRDAYAPISSYMTVSTFSPALPNNSDLKESSLTMSLDGDTVVLFSQQNNFLWMFVSFDGGRFWSCLDDLDFFGGDVGASMPSVKIYENNAYLFYMSGETLKFTVFSIPKITSLSSKCIGSLSSQVQDSSFTSSKRDMQSYLNKCINKTVSSIPNQKVSFERFNNGDFFVTYFDSSGVARSIRSSNHGNNWDFSPINW